MEAKSLDQIFNFRLLRFIAIAGLSFFSAKTTAYGFEVVLGGNSKFFSWIASLSITYILLGAAVLFFVSAKKIKIMFVSLLIYIICLIFSVSGSFLNFDTWLSQNYRDQEKIEKLTTEIMSYLTSVKNSIDKRSIAIIVWSSKLDKFLIEEEQYGVFSKGRRGKGRTYLVVSGFKKSLLSLEANLESKLKDIKVNIIEIKDIISLNEPSKDEIEKARNNILSISTEIRPILANHDSMVEKEIKEINKFVSAKSMEADVQTLVFPSQDYPKEFSKAIYFDTKLIARDVYQGLFNDIEKGDLKSTTLFSLFIAAALDILLFFVAFLDSIYFRKKQETEFAAETFMLSDIIDDFKHNEFPNAIDSGNSLDTINNGNEQEGIETNSPASKK